MQTDTTIVAVASTGPDFGIARLNSADGSLDNSFDADGKQTVDIAGADDARAVQLQPDGKILVVGDTAYDENLSVRLKLHGPGVVGAGDVHGLLAVGVEGVVEAAVGRVEPGDAEVWAGAGDGHDRGICLH